MEPNAQAPLKPAKSPLRKGLLWALIISLSFTALIAIFILLGGDYGEAEVKVLLTTAAIGIYSLTGLCCSSLYERGRYLPVALGGMIASSVGLLHTVLLIWDIGPLSTNWRLMLTLLILAVSSAHVSLLLLIREPNSTVRAVRALTFGCITIVAGLLIYLVYKGFTDETMSVIRFLGVFAVLDVLGTIVTPILRKVG